MKILLAVNLGLGSILDAAYLVEYCNYKGGTYYSDLRAKNGHPQPYDVKIWDLGNEVDGLPWELGHKNAEDYVETAREAAKAMKLLTNQLNLLVPVRLIMSQQINGSTGTALCLKALVIR